MGRSPLVGGRPEDEGKDMSDRVLPRTDEAPLEAWMPGPDDARTDLRSAAQAPAPLPPIDVVVRGEVPHGAVAYAHNKVVRTMSLVDEPVLHARLKLTMLPDPAVERPAVAEAVLDVNGDIVRAHVAGRSTPEAADLLERRLRDRLEHRRRRPPREPAQAGVAATWRHGMLPAHRPSYFDRPVEDREVVRHKAFPLGESTAEEAVFDMESLDYDFHLFVDLATGEDSLVWRTEDGYALARLRTPEVAVGPSVAGVTAQPAAAPVLTVEAAIERLNAGRERFVFFEDPSTGRGNVAYRRFDGHYGLLTGAPHVPG
jgi:hypothetical protein